MKNELNPFFLSGYHGPGYFCDREEESKRLVSNVRNGINSTLLSIRRMGKTGLIHHTFHLLQKDRKTKTIYIDIYATQNLKDLTNVIAAGILQAFPEKNFIGKKLMEMLKSFRPVISFDPLSGMPEVNLDFSQPRQYEQSLNSLFSFLDNQDISVIVGLDEFQQIAVYPEKNIEALLRTIIQPLKNVRFIFSGSNKHLLTEIFNDSKRPFFSSTQTVYLDAIPKEKYRAFIEQMFSEHKRKLTEEATEFILDFSRLHTYYTHAVCNRLFATGEKQINLSFVKMQCAELLKEQEHIFFQYRNLLTDIQWSLLTAIAKEGKVYQPTSKKFLSKYKEGTAANVQRALEALLNKEMVFQHQDEQGNFYSVYDCFLARWLESH